MLRAALIGAAAGAVLLVGLALASHLRSGRNAVPEGCRERVEILCADPSWPPR